MNFDLDGKIVDLQYKSPLALLQSRQDISNISEWINLISGLGESGLLAANLFETAKTIGKILNVPATLINEVPVEETQDETPL